MRRLLIGLTLLAFAAPASALAGGWATVGLGPPDDGIGPGDGIGLEVTPPRATPYFWARVPEGHTSASFAELVLDRADVVVSPGNAYGPSGEGYVRLSLTVPDDRLSEAMDRIATVLS
mgnify:CR=1 FL=1